MIHGLTTAGLGKPDFQTALDQHTNYVKALEGCGLEVVVLEADHRFPDSAFVEDVALCTTQCAVVTNPGAPSRNAEKEGMRSVLQSHFDIIEEIVAPGTLDAGDVMMAGSLFFIGISARTNSRGADQLIRILEKYHFEGIKVPLKDLLHLKSGVSFLEHNTVLVNGSLKADPVFQRFNRLVVEPDESYAANSLWINDTVLIPAGFPRTEAIIQAAGYKTMILEMSEFRKLDGGLSCLSLRF